LAVKPIDANSTIKQKFEMNGAILVKSFWNRTATFDTELFFLFAIPFKVQLNIVDRHATAAHPVPGINLEVIFSNIFEIPTMTHTHTEETIVEVIILRFELYTLSLETVVIAREG
jgi:hypothetical protein